MGNCHPSKTNVNLDFASVDIWFYCGDNFPCYSIVQYLYISESLQWESIQVFRVGISFLQ